MPIETSTSFLVLLAGIGVTLGFLIKDSNKISTILVLWPWVHVLGLIGLLVIGGMISEYILSLALMSIILLPMNLIGEGISRRFLHVALSFHNNYPAGATPGCSSYILSCPVALAALSNTYISSSLVTGFSRASMPPLQKASRTNSWLLVTTILP